MGVITRGIKNTFRNKIRTISFSVIIAISLGLAFSMSLANKAVSESNKKLRDDVGARLLVFPIGSLGGEVSFTNADADKIAKLPSVKEVIKTHTIVAQHPEEVEKNKKIDKQNSEKKNGNYETFSSSSSSEGYNLPGTSLRSAIGEKDLNTTAHPLPFTPTIPGIAIEGSTANVDSRGNKIRPVEGRLPDMNKLDEALLGKTLAEKNNLKIGSTFTIKDKTFKVVGIFDAGSIFENNRVVVSFAAMGILSDTKDKLSSLLVTAGSLETLDAAKKDILKALGDRVEVQPMQQEALQVASGLKSIAAISFITLIVALIAAGLIILLTMLLVVRERTKEIGILKAIGATNFKIVSQFVVEALVLNTIGALVGLCIAALASNILLDTLIASNVRTESALPQGVISLSPEQPVNVAQQLVQGIATFVDWQFIIFGLAVALGIALVAIIIPAFLIAKVRPAQIMRGDS